MLAWACDRVTVKMAASPSVTVCDAGPMDRVVVGGGFPVGGDGSDGESLSVIVKVRSAGAATPLPPDAVAETATCLSGVSTSLSTAVMVTVPVLVCEPAAMVSVRFVLRLKSDDVAGDTGVAETVSVTASVDAALSVAVTVVEPPFSEIDDELKVSDTVGEGSRGADVESSSVIVRV